MDRLRRGEARTELAPVHAHLVGIAGRGMSGLAQMLVQRGMLVTGSERSTGPGVERLRIRALPAGAAPRTGEGDLILRRPSATLVLCSELESHARADRP